VYAAAFAVEARLVYGRAWQIMLLLATSSYPFNSSIKATLCCSEKQTGDLAASLLVDTGCTNRAIKRCFEMRLMT